MGLARKAEETLATVIDPETGENVVAMGLIRDLAATKDGRVRLKFRPSSFHCPLAFALAFSIHRTLEQLDAVTGVDLRVEDCMYADEINRLLESNNP